ncbi:MAG: hypothetical protein HZB51_10840 [Chloroflexi bacterium]|nr:hypothetical protein [Chloroflexota bacterium]
MNTEGPALESLTRRLAECPVDFLAEPRIGKNGVVPVAAVVSDVMLKLGSALTPQQLAVFQQTDAKKYRNWLSAVCIASWLLSDAWFQGKRELANGAYQFLSQTLSEMAAYTNAPKFVTDPDRREELARMCLKDLGLHPANETEAQAQDRLSTLSAAERHRVIRAAQQAEERARAIREAMVRQAAADAAAKAARE